MSIPASLLALALLSLPAYAATVKIGTEKAEIRAVQASKQEMRLEVLLHGTIKQTFDHLGSGQEKLVFQGKESPLVVTDFDKDGFEEVLLRSAHPPFIGVLWTLYWNKDKKLFALALNERGDRNIAVPLKGKVEVLPEGGVQFHTSSGLGVNYQWARGHYDRISR